MNGLLEADVTMLTEALKTGYAEAAKVLPSETKITKTTQNSMEDIDPKMKIRIFISIQLRIAP